MAIQQLKDSLTITKRSRISFVSFNPVLTKDILLTELQRRENLEQNILFKDIQTLNNPLIIIILFGSYAKGTQTKHSDIDICLIHNNEEECQIIQNKLSIHPNCEIHSFEYSQFIRMLQQKTFNVGHEICKTGIPLQNVEGFYRVLQHQFEQKSTS